MAEAGRNIPVDGANIVTGLVFPNFGEFHALAFEGTFILPGKQVVGQVPGFEMKPLNFFQQFLGKHLTIYLIEISEMIQK